MSAHLDGQPRVTRFYTAARRVPILLGKLNGWRIPFGPYSLTQIMLGSAVLFAGYYTMPVWGPLTGAPLTQWGTLLFVAVGVTVVSGKLPSSKRKLPSVAADTMSAATAAPGGKFRGRPIKIAAPHLVGGSVLMQLEAVLVEPLPRRAPAPSATPAPLPVAAAPAITTPAPTPAPVTLPARSFTTGLDRLLEQARQKEQH